MLPLAIGVAAAHSRTSAAYSCTGQIQQLFSSFTGGAAKNGGAAPTFTTNGRAYCLTAIQTYHWNVGAGKAAGTLGLTFVSGPAGFGSVPAVQAIGSPGQNNAPNVNWQANFPTAPTPTVIDGTYKCRDSDPATWSGDTSGSPAFCAVYGIAASGELPPATTTTAANDGDRVAAARRLKAYLKVIDKARDHPTGAGLSTDDWLKLFDGPEFPRVGDCSFGALYGPLVGADADLARIDDHPAHNSAHAAQAELDRLVTVIDKCDHSGTLRKLRAGLATIASKLGRISESALSNETAAQLRQLAADKDALVAATLPAVFGIPFTKLLREGTLVQRDLDRQSGSTVGESVRVTRLSRAAGDLYTLARLIQGSS